MMSCRRRSNGWLLAAAASVIVAMLLAGCFNPFNPKVLGTGITLPPPAPNSPANTLRLLEWCYGNLEPSLYRELFTDDYRFAFSLLDPEGNAYRDNPWTREDELISTTRLFLGGDGRSGASSIRLDLDRNFNVLSDPRPGKRGRWHKSVRTSVTLSILSEGSQTNVTGFANFYLVRGDSALLPQELTDRGFAPDSSRWYIERWEDETAQLQGTTAGGLGPAPLQTFAAAAMPPGAGGAASHPARAPGVASRSSMRGVDHARASTLPLQLSWGALKAIYR